MIRGQVILALFIIILIVTAVCHADEQAFSISKAMKFENSYQKMAVNSATGDVVVAWLNTESAEAKRVYAALCTLLKNDKFKVKKAIRISDQTGVVTKLDVEYNPLDDSYLVIWDSYEGAKYQNPLNIFTQKLSNKGKKSGGRNQVTESGQSYGYPEIHYVEGIPVAPPPSLDKGCYLLIYDRRFKTPPYTDSGVYRSYLDHEGKATQGPLPAMISAPFFRNGRAYDSYPSELTRLQDGSFVLALNKGGSEESAVCPFLLKMSDVNLGDKQVKLCGDISEGTEFIQLTNKICFSSWNSTAETSRWVDQLFRPKLKKVKKEFDPVAGKKTFVNELVKLEDDPGGYQLSSDGQYLLGREIGKKGKLGAQIRTLFDHHCLLNGLDAVCLPGSNRIFVSWVEILNGDTELKGFVFDAK